MFDFAWSEFALIGIVGLLFIGPKDMPTAIRTVTRLLKKGRKLAGEFQTHVDEMVRDADLGEARDQFRQLRTLNVRGQIMKAIDEDGSIQRTLSSDPLKPNAPTSLPMPELPGPVMKPPVPAGGRGRHGLDPASTRSWDPAGTSAAEADEDPALASADPAPSILPPSVAKRLRVERARPMPPRFLPPRAGGVGRPTMRYPSEPDRRVAVAELAPETPERMPEPSYPVDAGLS